jgi:hypothetical protein
MSQQNVAVARRWVELFNGRGDVDEFLSLHDPGVELQTPGGPRLRGIESGEIAHEGESAGAFWFRDGKIITWQPFETHAAALKETGLRE